MLLDPGDSLAHKGMSPPKEIIRKLQWWLKHRFGTTFKNVGNQLEHGKQEDWTDCGIVSANTAAREIFRDEPLWTVEKKQLERVAWFVKLCQAHIDDVSFLTWTSVDQYLMSFLKQIDENINTQHYETTAKVISSPERSKVQNMAHSLLHILNPLPHDNDTHLFQGTDILQTSNEAGVPRTVDMANQMPDSSDLQLTGGQLVAGQPKLYPLPMLKNGVNETTGQDDKGASDPGETENTKKRVLPCESGDKRRDRPCKVARTNIRPAACVVSGSKFGGSKSAIWERCQNERFVRGQIEADPHSAGKFEDKIRRLDKNAHIFDSKSVRHVKCGKTFIMKYPYGVGNFRTHVLRCRGPPKSAKLPGGGMQLITTFFKGTSAGNAKGPCPGLTEKEYPDVAMYLARTGAHGGGAPSVTVVAQELYGKKYRKLSKVHKGYVKTAQQHEWQWRNDHDHGRVFATNCFKVSALSAIPLVPCLNCCSLLTNKKFKNAAHVPQPPDSRYKYVNYEYRNKQLAILYGRCTGLRAIIESTVSGLVLLPVFVTRH